MGLPVGQRRILQRAETALRRSDPRLSALFSLFSRLNRDEEMPRTEQLRGRVAIVLAPLLRPFTAFGRRLHSPRRAPVRTALFFPLTFGLVASAVLAGSSSPGSSAGPQTPRISRVAHTSATPKRPRVTRPPRAATPAFSR